MGYCIQYFGSGACFWHHRCVKLLCRIFQMIPVEDRIVIRLHFRSILASQHCQLNWINLWIFRNTNSYLSVFSGFVGILGSRYHILIVFLFIIVVFSYILIDNKATLYGLWWQYACHYWLVFCLTGTAIVQSSSERWRPTVWSAVKCIWFSSWALFTIHSSCFVCLVRTADGRWRNYWAEESGLERQEVRCALKNYHLRDLYD